MTTIGSRDPFLPDTPVVWSISGGLTSGYMLWRRLQHGPQRPDEFFTFANTGKEREETLAFLREIETRWGVDLVWLQRTPGGGIERVTFETAAREGEPFTQLINERRYLPNPVTRFCTVELKIRTVPLERMDDVTEKTLFDFGGGPIPAHRHPNGGGWVADTDERAAQLRRRPTP